MGRVESNDFCRRAGPVRCKKFWFTYLQAYLVIDARTIKGCELAEWAVLAAAANLLVRQNESSLCTDDDMGTGAGEEYI
jgi:hypothetical protein